MRNNATETEKKKTETQSTHTSHNTKLKWTWEESLSAWHLCQSASSARVELYDGVYVRLSVHVIAEAHGPLLRPRKPICFRFAPVARIRLCPRMPSPALMRRAVMGADGMRCGWKAGKGDVCICDNRECFMVLNVADRTGLEPSPGTRTSLQVTSKSGQCCQNDVTQTAYWAYIARLQGAILVFCFVSFFFFVLLQVFWP